MSRSADHGEVLVKAGEEGHLHYRVFFSDEDHQWVAQADEYPSVSWLADNPLEALGALMDIIFDEALGL